MNKYILTITLIIASASLTYITLGVSRTEHKIDSLITSHKEVSDEFFSALDKLEAQVAIHTTSINELNKALEDFQ